ncbi:MAG: hypothetical protein JJU02_11980, partial [Cryomorphaceae bacterium]|nr:hypothetical protein [Cryomorphaceae bacterium]
MGRHFFINHNIQDQPRRGVDNYNNATNTHAPTSSVGATEIIAPGFNLGVRSKDNYLALYPETNPSPRDKSA